MNEINIVFQPNPGSQTQALESNAKELLIGGTAGSAKSAALVIYPLRFIKNPNFRGLILRKTIPEIKRSILVETYKFYPGFGATYNENDKEWTFPSGAIVQLGFLDADRDTEIYKSAQYCFIGFDETTSFTEYQYTYMFSRLRSSDKTLPLVIRGATNPDGPDHWLYKRYAPWLDDKYPIKAISGQVLYYTYDDDKEEIHLSKPKSRISFARQYIFAHVDENPHLSQEYKHGLSLLKDEVERARLRDGLWVGAGKGTYFKRHWFKTVHSPETNSNTNRIRYWDRASTADAGDYTVGLLLSEFGGKYCVEDVVRLRGKPSEVEETILRTAKQDGLGVMIGLEQDPGSAGVFEISYYINKLQGYTVIKNKVNIRKEVRAKPISTQAEQGNVSFIESVWNSNFFSELEAFPEGRNDDQVDALSGAFNKIYAYINGENPEIRTPRRDYPTVSDPFEDDDEISYSRRM